jgi:hypothetical protein
VRSAALQLHSAHGAHYGTDREAHQTSVLGAACVRQCRGGADAKPSTVGLLRECDSSVFAATLRSAAVWSETEALHSVE